MNAPYRQILEMRGGKQEHYYSNNPDIAAVSERRGGEELAFLSCTYTLRASLSLALPVELDKWC